MRSGISRILLFCILLSGCSVFKASTKDESVSVQHERNNDVITELLENIQIDIPVEVFKARYIAGEELPESTGKASGQKDTSETYKPVADKKVRITVNRKKTTTDKSTVKADSSYQLEETEEVKKETKGLFGFGGGFIIAIVLIAALIIYFKFFA